LLFQGNVEMKKIFTTIISIFFICFSYSQNIGLRANTEFSDIKRINNSLGVGLYLNINDFSKKIEILFSFDFTKNEKDFLPINNNPSNSCVYSSFHKLFFSTSPLYVLPIEEKIKTKIGPVFNYNSINASDDYMGMISSYKSKHIGFGIIANIQFQKILKLPVNIDIFITPQYLINIKNENSPIGVKSDYADNLKILNIQVGLSFILNE